MKKYKYMEIQELQNEISQNWDKFTKSKNDNGEFVIIAEKDDSGSYEQYKECLGVLKNGDLIWSYLSGCSCSGGNDNETVSDVSVKIFKIDNGKTVAEFYQQNRIEPYEANYESY